MADDGKGGGAHNSMPSEFLEKDTKSRRGVSSSNEEEGVSMPFRSPPADRSFQP